MARSSSAPCPLPTSAFLHGAVSPLLWKMMHDVWSIPPLPPAPSQPVQSCMVLSPLLWKMLHVWHIPRTAPSHSVQSCMALSLLSCVSCFMYDTFPFAESCSNDLYCSFYCSRSCFVVLFFECTLCGVSHDNCFASRCLPSLCSSMRSVCGDNIVMVYFFLFSFLTSSWIFVFSV
jgi:hypothetical protein